MSGDTQGRLSVFPDFDAGQHFSELWSAVMRAGESGCDAAAWNWARHVTAEAYAMPLRLAEMFVELALTSYKASLLQLAA